MPMVGKTIGIIETDINNLTIFFDRKDPYADCAVHATLGKIGLGVQLGLLTKEHMEELTDALFLQYEKLQEEK